MTRYSGVADWERLPSRQLRVNGIELHVTEHGEGPLVVLCHGFPELGFSWRHQVFALAEAGYRTLTPDLRGFGRSSCPADIAAYDILTVGNDLTGLLDEAGAEDAVFVGHDWGAAVVWNLALTQPGRVRAVAGLSVPVTPRAPAPPIQIMRSRLGESFYMVWFQQPGVADDVLNENVRATLLADNLWAERPVAPHKPRRWLAPEEFEFFVAAFERTGFTGGLNYYRNIDRNWELTEPYATRTIGCPSMFLTGSKDLVATFMSADRIRDIATGLREHVVIDGAGHWIQQERPGEVTEALLRFLRSV
jgi:pimeloyl-ACP methyl ester carboxylesterase